MEYKFEKILELFPFQASSTLWLAIGLLFLVGMLFILGRRLEPAVLLERLGIPIALLVGAFALFFGPYGKIPLVPSSVTDIWVQLPSAFLTLVFATLMIGRPIPNIKQFWKPVAYQSLLGLLLGFGQYLVGGLAVIFILIPYLGVDPLMGCLIEVGYEGGHGAAAIMGDSFFDLGFPEGLDLGLALATVGLLSSTILGSILVILGRWFGWLAPSENVKSETSIKDQIKEGIGDQIRQLAINLGLAGLAVLLGLFMLVGIRNLAPFLGGSFEKVALVFPVFPLALLGSFLIRYILEVTGNTPLVSQILQREIGSLSTDLLITTATASLNLKLLLNDWIPLTILAITGLLWNLFGMLVFARLIFREEWFERSLTEFGNATGVAASGILLLRLADPRDQTNTLPIFSIKQLLLQPLLSGGLVTVVAPIAISQLGLKNWTEICGLLTILFIAIAFIIRFALPKEYI